MRGRCERMAPRLALCVGEILIEIAGNNDVVVWVGIPQGLPIPRLKFKRRSEGPPVRRRDAVPRTSEPWQHHAIHD